jgi:hypothetical protein
VFVRFTRLSTEAPAMLHMIAYWGLAVSTPLSVVMTCRRVASPWTTLIMVSALLALTL